MQRISRTALSRSMLAAVLALACASILPGQNKKDKEDPTVRSLQGQVVDPDDKPAAGAIVQLKDTRTLQVRSFITQANGELTYHTNIMQLAPRERIAEYAAAQSLLLGIRGTLAPFAAAALLAGLEPRVVLLLGLAFMAAGTVIMAFAVRAPKEQTPEVISAAALPSPSLPR